MYFPPAHELAAPEDIGDTIAEGDMLGVPWFDTLLGDQIGQTTNLALSSLYPNTREDTMNFYSGDATLTRDFVGVGQFFSDPDVIPTGYGFTGVSGNSYGWNRIIGEGYGSAPGSFAINTAIEPAAMAGTAKASLTTMPAVPPESASILETTMYLSAIPAIAGFRYSIKTAFSCVRSETAIAAPVETHSSLLRR